MADFSKKWLGDMAGLERSGETIEARTIDGESLTDVEVGGTGGSKGLALGTWTVPSAGASQATASNYLYIRCANGIQLQVSGGGFTSTFGFASNKLSLTDTGSVNWSSTSLPTGSVDTKILRDADGVIRVTDGSGVTGSVLSTKDVEVNTAEAGAPNVITDAESGRVFVNTGATGENVHKLEAGMKIGAFFTFVNADADGMELNADTGETIRIGASVSASAGLIETTTIGAVVTLLKVSATEWFATQEITTWTVT